MSDELTDGSGRTHLDGAGGLHLRVHPSVVFKLGEDLITDDVQALVELVKNAYDADALRVTVRIDTQVWTDRRSGRVVPPPARDRDDKEHVPGVSSKPTEGSGAVQGMITVSDDGVGMTPHVVQTGWLTVSASPKKAMKAKGEVTGRKRTPLGDKGLGRLGAQRLGQVLDLVTVPADSKSAYRITIPWHAFENAASLDEVELSLLQEERGDRKNGSTLHIRGLHHPERWQGERLVDLQRDLSTMISPFYDFGFKVNLTVDGAPVDLRFLPQSIRDAADLSYKLRYSDGRLVVSGKLSTQYLSGNTPGEIASYRELIERDNGIEFLDWLLQKQPDKARSIGLTHGDDRYFAHVSQTFDISKLDGLHLEGGAFADPGPFVGEVDQVGLKEDVTGIFDSVSEYRSYVRQINGIRIYRNGFGIRLSEKDWLRLGERWTKGQSFYNLRPENVIGFIELTAAENASLVETTNREGFQDTSAYRNFLSILERWRAFTETAQSFLRRSFTDYRKEQLSANAQVSVNVTPAALVESVRERVLVTRKQTERARTMGVALRDVRKAVEDIRQDKAESEASLFPGSVSPKTFENALSRVGKAMDQADSLSSGLEELNEQYVSQLNALALLSERIRLVENQLSEAWEAVALGLTAEALSHEVHQISDRLRGRSAQLARYLDDNEVKDVRIRAFLEHVRSSAAALSRQLSHLNPALKYVRERREDLKLSGVLADIASYYNERWSGRGLRMKVTITRDFMVHMNLGKMIQVFDNLILNSEYWLLEQIRRGDAQEGAVLVEVRSPCVTIEDTGPGVEPAVEDLLFEPFVTMKGRGKGRGLGLFVVAQLLDAEAADIRLDPERSSDGRRRRFRITFVDSSRHELDAT